MDDTMNTGVEVTTEVSGAEDVTQEITIEETSGGPSKGFMALVVGGIAAAVVGTVVAVKRHKKKKASESAVEEYKGEDLDEFVDDDLDDVYNVGEIPVEESKEEPAEKK